MPFMHHRCVLHLWLLKSTILIKTRNLLIVLVIFRCGSSSSLVLSPKEAQYCVAYPKFYYIWTYWRCLHSFQWPRVIMQSIQAMLSERIHCFQRSHLHVIVKTHARQMLVLWRQEKSVIMCTLIVNCQHDVFVPNQPLCLLTVFFRLFYGCVFSE